MARQIRRTFKPSHLHHHTCTITLAPSHLRASPRLGDDEAL
jgi:hypothetical protein